MKRINILVIAVFILVACFYLFHFLFFWIFPSTDSHFYTLFAQFLKTGIYSAPHPYYYQVPSTMEPPLYSVFLYLILPFNRSDVLIHFFQLAGLFASGIFLYKILRWYIGNKWALAGAVLYLFTPSHLIYLSNLVAESLAVFYLTLFLYLLHKIISEKKIWFLPWILPLAAIIGLHRYNLLPYFGISVLLAIQNLKFKSFQQQIISQRKALLIGIFSSFLILAGWVIYNHRLNGSWGFSNAEGKHLYNRILHFDRLLPPADNPSFKKFKSMVGEGVDYFKPWWYYEQALISVLGNETAASNVMGEVALAALINNPARYLLNTPSFFLFAHADNPTYHDGLYRYSGTMKGNCSVADSIEFCRPIVKTEKAFILWDQLVEQIDRYYLSIHKYLNFFILFPALIFFLVKGPRLLRLFACLYLLGIATFVTIEAPLPRYTYIFTPLAWVLTYMFVIKMLEYLLHHLPNQHIFTIIHGRKK